MLMPDSCHPAVLNLLPFTSNDASNAKALLSSGDLYAPEDIRVFPVLAVTRTRRKENDGMTPNAGSRTTAMSDSAGDPFRPTRVSSERCSRRQTTDDDLLKAARPRVKSEYDVQRSVAADSLSRDPATCAVTNINERIVELRASPRAEGARRQGKGHAWMPLDVVGPAGVEGFHPPPPGWTLPKPGLTSSIIAFSGDGVDRDEVDGKYPFLRHPLWRSVTLTPGELDLMKHKEHVKGLQVYQGISTSSSNNSKSSGPSKRFKGSKLNVRDLPRSTTPLNDHDPDRLNMKQVIAFLQSKGAPVADAVQLSSDPTAADDTCSAPSRRPSKVSILRRGVNRLSTSVSLGAERADDGAGVFPSVTSGRRVGDCESSSKSCKVRDGQSERSQHTPLPDGATVSRCGSADARGEVTTRKRQQQQQQRPFRLHRFLTMVPTPNDEFQEATHVPSNSPNSRLARQLRGDAALDKPVPEECVKRLSSFGRHHPLPDVESGATCTSSAEAKTTYRLSSRRPTSPDVTLNEDPAQDNGISGGSDGPRRTVFDDFFDDKNVIRLPNVLVDSDEEDGPGEEDVCFANTHKPKPKTAASQTPAKKTTTKTISVSNRSKHKQELSAQRSYLSNVELVASPNRSPAKCDVANERHDTYAIQKESGSYVTGDSKETRFQETAQERATASCTRQVKIKLPRESGEEEKSLVRKHPPDVVTLTLRKERTRTREHTYMSEIAGSNVMSEGALGPTQVT